MRVLVDNIVHRCGCRVRKRTFQTAQRMIGDVQTQHFTFEIQFLAAFPVGNIWNCHRKIVTECVVHAKGTEEVELACCLFAFHGDRRVYCRLVYQRKRTASMFQLVESTRFNQRFNGAFITHNQGNFLQEVVERLEVPLLFAGCNHTVDHVCAHVTNSAHTETDILPHRRKGQGGFVHIRGQHGNTHSTAFVEVQSQLILVIAHTR